MSFMPAMAHKFNVIIYYFMYMNFPISSIINVDLMFVCTFQYVINGSSTVQYGSSMVQYCTA